MRFILKFIFPAALLALATTGCRTPARDIQPVGGGYQEVTHPGKSGDPSDARISLEYRAPDGRITLVWPSLSGVDEIIHGNLALFVGDKTYASSDPDAPRATRPRLFAVQEPGLPLDVTDGILQGWTEITGKDFAQAERLLEMVTPAEVDNKLEVQLQFWEGGYGWPDNATVVLTWNQVSDLMRTVREQGTLQRDLRWHTPYLEK